MLTLALEKHSSKILGLGGPFSFQTGSGSAISARNHGLKDLVYLKVYFRKAISGRIH